MAEEGQEEISQTLSKLGIKAPRPYDPKKDKSFNNWLRRLDYHFALIKLADDQKNSAVLCQLDTDAFEIAHNIGITNTTVYAEACTKMKDQYALTETVEELREKFSQRRQNAGENLDTYARDLRILASRAFETVAQDVLEILLIKQYIDGIRDATTKERLLVKRPATLSEAVHYSRLSEMAVHAARGGQVHETSTVSAVSNFGFQNNNCPQGFQNQNFQNQRFQYPMRTGNFNNSYGSYKPRFGYQNFQRPQFGNWYNNQYKRSEGQVKQFQGKCFYCGRYGHKQSQCYKLQGKPQARSTRTFSGNVQNVEHQESVDEKNTDVASSNVVVR